MNYFEANPKNNPLVLTITTLFRYFLNLLTYHYQKKTTPNTQEMARLLGVHPFFMKDYIDGGKDVYKRQVLFYCYCAQQK